MKTIFGVALAAGLTAVHAPAQTALTAGNLPLWFEANHGQAGAAAPFIAHGPDSEFLMSATSAQFVLRKSTGETAAATMQFIGASPSAQISGDSELSGKVNYLLGNNPAQWQSGVPTFAKVRAANVYPGINVVYYGNGRQLEYDFDLAAGIDPKTIALRFDGAEKISVNPQGELVVNLNGGEVIQHQPLVYQTTGTTRREISGGYQLLDAHTATFALGSYDHSLPLVIDPVLSYSTYFGGNNGDIIHAIALGSDGSVFVAGETLSTIFTNAPAGYQTNFHGGFYVGDAYVAKFDNLGTNLIYLTYLGGSDEDAAYGLAVDSSGNAYLTGATSSSDFPTTTNALFPKIAGQISSKTGHYWPDAFVSELNSNGSTLVYSTFLGGSYPDVGNAIAVDMVGNAYVAGYTYSTNLPVTTNALQLHLGCTNSLYGNINQNGFVAEIARGGTNLNYCSFLGGTNYDRATAVAVDLPGNVYVTGYTASTNFPTKNYINQWIGTNRFDGHYLNGATNATPAFDAFVSKFQPNFAGLVYSTLIGGSNNDFASGIAVDGAGNAYVVGSTISTNFPYTTNILARFGTNLTSFVQTNNTGYYFYATNSFLAQVQWNGTNASLGYSLTFGGFGIDVANGVAVDAAGNVFVVGSASSTNFPVTTNLSGYLSQTNASGNASSLPITSDAFVIAFNTNATALLYSTYLGGNGYAAYYGGGNDFGNAIAVDPLGNAYIAGQTMSTNFPTVNARQTFLAGTNDAFLAKILLLTQPPGLNIKKLNPANAQLSWPGFLPEFSLETRTNLLGSNQWSLVAQPVVVSNLLETVTVADTNSAAFFRLHKY
jgi:hypothetical protein